jgi:type IV pilus assembly protein PilW
MSKLFAGCDAGQQRGVTLIELMVSLLIGMIVLVAGLYGFANSQNVARGNDDLARLQESGRIVTTALDYDLRMVSYAGCLEAVGGIDSNPIIDNSVTGLNVSMLLQGLQAQWVAPTATVPGYHRLTLFNSTGNGGRLTQNLDVGDTTIHAAAFSGAENMVAGDLVLVSNCQTGAHITRISAATVTGTAVTVALGTAGALDAPPGGGAVHYGKDDAFLYRFGEVSKVYELRPVARLDGISTVALFRGSDELVDGVEAFRVCVGEGTSDKKSGVTTLKSASASGINWENARSAQVDLLVTAPKPTAGEDLHQSFTLCDGSTFGDGGTALAHPTSLYKLFSTTVALRNKLK